MMTSLAVTIMGKNQPGIISNLSDTAANQKANWLESHLAEIAGQFAGIVHLEVPNTNIENLKKELVNLEALGLSVTVAEATVAEIPPTNRKVHLELVGQDHPGIVRDISQALAEHNVSIEEMKTERSSGSMAGGLIFKACAILSVPENISDDELDDLLQSVSSSIMVEVVLDQNVDSLT